MENSLKWMIWGYPYFRKHPYRELYSYKNTTTSKSPIDQGSSHLAMKEFVTTIYKPFIEAIWEGESPHLGGRKRSPGVINHFHP